MPAWSRSTRPCMCSPIASMCGRRRRISRRRSSWSPTSSASIPRPSMRTPCSWAAVSAATAAAAPAVTRQAAEISKQVGRPVKVIWPREEDLAQDKQRPLAVAKLTAAIGDDGLPTALFTRAAWFSIDGINQIGGATADYGIYNMPYLIPASSARAAQRQDSHPELDASCSRRQPARFHGRELRRRDGHRRRMGSARMAPQDDGGHGRLAARAQDAQGEVRVPDRPPEGRGHGRGGRSSRTAPSPRPAPRSRSAAVAGSRSRRSWWCWMRVASSIRIPPPSSAKVRSCWELSHAWTGGLELENGRFVNTNFDTYNLLRIDQHAACRDHLRVVRRQEMGRPRRAGRPARAAGRRQRDLLRDRQAHPRNPVPQPGSDLERLGMT